jgi:hypothetical protein
MVFQGACFQIEALMRCTIFTFEAFGNNLTGTKVEWQMKHSSMGKGELSLGKYAKENRLLVLW